MAAWPLQACGRQGPQEGWLLGTQRAEPRDEVFAGGHAGGGVAGYTGYGEQMAGRQAEWQAGRESGRGTSRLGHVGPAAHPFPGDAVITSPPCSTLRARCSTGSTSS